MYRTLTTLLVFAALALGALQARAQSVDPARMAEGAQVFADNCQRCHSVRSPAERTDREWYTIVSHMRTRANLTRSEAEAVVVYLKASNPPEHPPSENRSAASPSPDSSVVTSSIADAEWTELKRFIGALP